MRTALGALLFCVASWAGCGPAVDHTATLARLRDAIEEPVADASVAEEHNRLVEQVVHGGALDGLRQSEVQARIGRGDECGTRPLCAEHGFRPSDWTYEVGRDPANHDLGAGPTLVVGFDPMGRVDGTYFVTRR